MRTTLKRVVTAVALGVALVAGVGSATTGASASPAKASTQASSVRPACGCDWWT